MIWIELNMENKLPSVGTFFGDAWKQYRAQLELLAKIRLVPAVLALLIGLAAARNRLGLAGIGSIVSIVVELFAYAALLYVITHPAQTTPAVGDAYANGKKRLGSIIWILFLTSLLSVGGAFFFLVPGIIFSIWFSLAVFVFAVEGHQGIGALMKSREYVRGHWWAVLGRVVLLSVGIGILVSLPQQLLISAKIPLLASLYNFIVSIFVTPFAMVGTYTLYRHLRGDRDPATVVPSTKDKRTVYTFAILGWIIALGLLVVAGAGIYHYLSAHGTLL